jgi:hypothetical protein
VAKSQGTPEQQPQAEATQEAAQDPVGEAQSGSAEPREQAIAQAAYYKAEQRGFEPGHEMEDWLDAEREVASAEAKP